MIYLNSDDSIIACSTSTSSNAAIAIIRISGFKKISTFSDFFSINLESIQPRKIYLTDLKFNSQVYDKICLTYFEGPNSYNGENILELSVHGNLLNIERIINLFCSNGVCREASPGEFTYRALRNKKLTLSQVEGLDLALNANSFFALDQGNSLLHGDLYSAYEQLFNSFLAHKSSLELMIDFSEDIDEKSAKNNFNRSLELLESILKKLHSRCGTLPYSLIQPSIVLYGIPNAGKSSLFNNLLGEDRAIVSSIPGTTRDYVTEIISICGVNYKLIDTAGIRDSSDLIESEGVKRSKQVVDNSFYKILVINPFDFEQFDIKLLSLQYDLILFSHSDLPDFSDAKSRFVSLFAPIGPTMDFSIKNSVIDLNSVVNKKYLYVISNQPILISRHRHVISNACSSFEHYQQAVSKETDVAIISSELNTLGHCISELIGIISPDTVLNDIFENFCIGK